MMFFQQFYTESLGHASYLLGDERTSKALVFDPRRDIGGYLDAAREHGFRIAFGADSHGHNDYLSGLNELPARTGAQLWGSAAGELGYDHRPLRDGETIEIGDIGVEVVHTPGHTPEHIALLVYDRAMSADVPAMLLSGGALLVGDLARPDLLGGLEEAREAAREFCATIQAKLLPLPDHVEVYPTHVAGSLCGGNIGSRLSTTIGYERRTNAILAEVDSKEEFVEECIRLDNLPAVPPYWRRMRSQNMAGVAPLGVLHEPEALNPREFAERNRDGCVILDARDPESFAGGHIPDALNVGLGSSFATWAGTVVPGDARILLVLDRPGDLWEAIWQLLRVGYALPVGWLAGGMRAWRTAALPIEALPQLTVSELASRLDTDDVRVLDVRQPTEWASGHIPGATFVTGANLPERVSEVPEGTPLAVVCSSGYRSSVAASLLARHGRKDIANVTGGMSAWKRAGLPVESNQA